MGINCNFNLTNYNPNVISSQLSNLEIAITNNDLETLDKIIDSDQFIHLPLIFLENSLKSAIASNQFNVVKALLNSNRSDDLTSESLNLILTHDDIYLITIIIESKVFNEISAENLQGALNELISANKLDIVTLILNTLRYYDVEIFHMLERAALKGNKALFNIILDCNNLEQIPENVLLNCFHNAKEKTHIEIIKLLFNSRKTVDLPETIFKRVIAVEDPMDIEILRTLINSRKFNSISIKKLNEIFVNAVIKDTPLVECFLNSNRVHDIYKEVLSKYYTHKKINHYGRFIEFHKKSPRQDGVVYSKEIFLAQEELTAIEIINCKKCNKKDFFSIDLLINILYDCIKDDRSEILDAILNSGRIIEIDEPNFIYLLRSAFSMKKIDVVNKFINSYSEKSKQCLLHIFESAICNNEIQLLTNILDSNLNMELPLLSYLDYAVDNNNLLLINLLISKNKISQEDLFIFLYNAINNVILNPKDELQIKILYTLMSHNDSLSNLRLILDDFEEKQLFFLEYAIKNEITEIINLLLSSPKFSVAIIKFIFDNLAINENEKLLDTILNYPGFSFEDLLPIIENLVEENNLNLIKAFIKHKKISEKNTLEIFEHALKNRKISLLSTISFSPHISKEKVLLELKNSLNNNELEITKALLNSENIPKKELLDFLINSKDNIGIKKNEIIEIASLLLSSTKYTKCGINENEELLDTLLNYPGFSPQDLLPIIEKLIEENNLNLIKIFIKYKKIPEENTLEIFEHALKNCKTNLISTISSSLHISKEKVLLELKNSLKNNELETTKALLNSKKIPKKELLNFLMNSDEITLKKIRSLESMIDDQSILDIFKKYKENHESRTSHLVSSYYS